MPKLNSLNIEEERVMTYKGTEAPHTGEYNLHFEKGYYTCKQCDSVLYMSENKFDGHCGWPSFDEALNDSVEEIPDSDGHRVEIVCRSCNGHLGHIFRGEGFTEKNTRHCVNSVSLNFIEDHE